MAAAVWLDQDRIDGITDVGGRCYLPGIKRQRLLRWHQVESSRGLMQRQNVGLGRCDDFGDAGADAAVICRSVAE